MEPDISRISSHLQRNAEGIWVSDRQAEISYPEEGNENCLALETDSFWFEHRSRCIEAVMKRFPPPGPVFDIGGGNGYVAVGLQQAGFPVALLEPGRHGIENARRRGLNHLIWSTLEGAGFYEQSLPAAGLFDVLEHIQEDEMFLRAIYQILVPGGKLYLTVPAYTWLWSAADDYAGHYRRYTLRVLAELLGKAGFRCVFSTYLFWMLPVPALLFRSIPSRLGKQKPADWQRYQKEHAEREGLSGRLLDEFLGWELKRIRSGTPMRFGASCLVAAER